MNCNSEVTLVVNCKYYKYKIQRWIVTKQLFMHVVLKADHKNTESLLTGHDVCGYTAFNTSFSSGSFLLLTLSLKFVKNRQIIIIYLRDSNYTWKVLHFIGCKYIWQKFK